MTYSSEAATRKHIAEVSKYISLFVREMLSRAEDHDASKLEDPEKAALDEATPRLEGLTYGSPEYKANLELMKPFVQHHNDLNDHHPEHHAKDHNENPFARMDLFQIVELICDWTAATKRHADGNIFRSIEINATRFNISPQLTQILRNTAKKMADMEVNGK